MNVVMLFFGKTLYGVKLLCIIQYIPSVVISSGEIVLLSYIAWQFRKRLKAF